MEAEYESSFLFDPDHIASTRDNWSLENEVLNTEELLKYGKMVTAIRTRIKLKSEAMARD